MPDASFNGMLSFAVYLILINPGSTQNMMTLSAKADRGRREIKMPYQDGVYGCPRFFGRCGRSNGQRQLGGPGSAWTTAEKWGFSTCPAEKCWSPLFRRFEHIRLTTRRLRLSSANGWTRRWTGHCNQNLL